MQVFVDSSFTPDGPSAKPTHGRSRLFLIWLPVLLVLAYWYLNVSLVRNHQDIDQARTIVTELAMSTTPTQALISLRRAMPLVAMLNERQQLVEALESRLGRYESRLLGGAENERLGGEVQMVIRLLDTRIDALVSSSDQMWQQMMSLVVVMSLIAVGLLGMQANRSRRRDPSVSAVDREIFQHSPGPAVLCNADDSIIAANDAYCRMTGYSELELIGKAASFNHSGDFAQSEKEEMSHALVRDGQWSGELWLRKKSGEAIADKVLRLAMRDRQGDVTGYITLSQDIMGSDDANRLKLWQAHHDTLTKLPNRNLLNERLSRALLGGQGLKVRGALISVDIDRFKTVNESIGADAGDQLLMETAVRLAIAVRESDMVARLGSDQFAIMMTDIEDFSDAERAARDILKSMQQAFGVNSREVFVTASIGIVMFPDDGEEPSELIQKADAARALVKAQGGNALAFFESKINDRAAHILELEIGLRKALGNDELKLFFQPIVDLKQGRVARCEALLRWQNPELGTISPGEFIPVAEDSGLIIEIGQWVLRQTQEQVRQWRDQGLDISVSINVSVRQLMRSDDMEAFLRQLATGGAQGLTIELTESAFADKASVMQSFIERVQDLGATVALDDFGTGYSSLSYLRDFRFDTLKIDKSFMDHVVESPRDLGLVASIVSMGRILGMGIVAEGIETEAQLNHLARIGCDYVQGFYFSRPIESQALYDFATGFSCKPMLPASSQATDDADDSDAADQTLTHMLSLGIPDQPAGHTPTQH